jgi:DNA-binding protein H-NS
MATIIGESGTWKGVLGMARSNGLTLVDPPDVGKQLSEAQRGLQQQLAQVEDDLARKERALDQQVVLTRAQHKHDVTLAIEQLQSDVARIEGRLISPNGTPRRWLAQVCVRLSVRSAAAKRRSQHQAYIRQLAEKVTQAKQELANFTANRQSEIDARTGAARHTIDVLQGIAASSELPGAIAERAVIKELGRLPNEYVLMNDVHLEYHKYIHFDGDYLKTAQLDHVLIGPAGVYVIETKNWSQEFLASGQYFSPFKQVKRASYLCYRILKEAGFSCHVRSVVACEGAMPATSPDSHIPVVPVTRLFSFVQYGERALSAQQMEEIRRVLS